MKYGMKVAGVIFYIYIYFYILSGNINDSLRIADKTAGWLVKYNEKQIFC